MKKSILLKTNFTICFIIIIGFLSIVLMNNKTSTCILEDDIENISKLTSSTIYSEIDNELTKPIYVAQTMANDTFLKSWLRDEYNYSQDLNYVQQLQDYLYAFKMKYNYDSVFLVSGKSNIYYYYEGINKSVSPKDSHDVWYYNFFRSNKLYDLDVDTDEVNNNELTVFVNCKIVDTDGAFMGVIGVGLKMSQLQKLFSKYENDFQLKAFLIDDKGLVQIHSDSSKIEIVNIFENERLFDLEDDIINNKSSMEIHWYPFDKLDNCLITRYIDNLNWYLVVEKNTVQIRDLLTLQFQNDLKTVVVIIIFALLVITYVIRRYNRVIMQVANTDELTGLPNAKSFSDIFYKKINLLKYNESIVFMFDIDHFKVVNDEKGHLFGNKVISEVGNVTKNILGNKGVISRWGGDEFVGVMYDNSEDFNSIMLHIMEKFSGNSEEGSYSITLSVGAVIVKESKNLEKLIDDADKAMYVSKKSGRDRITFFEE